jgi:ubiquinone/menaquinone biosynthesis C-methylase UbiE
MPEVPISSLSPAAQAFDGAAAGFDRRFGEWQSVAVQRRAVRDALAAAFPEGSRLLEVGGGTGEDARWLCERNRRVFLTDASPAMVETAAHKLRDCPSAQTAVVAAEDLESWSHDGEAPFDGAYSNFAALNCVPDLRPVARGLARLVRPGGAAMLVVFGVCSPGEMLVQCVRGDLRAALRRTSRGNVPARLGGRAFEVRYHRARAITAAMTPMFTLTARQGIGVFVPPSAAEPWISQHPVLLRRCEAVDRLVSRPLAMLGDHVLYHFTRTDAPLP